MIDQDPGHRPGETRLRRAGGAAFVAGTLAALLCFGFAPGLPHIIDWGAILTSLLVGVVARWGCRTLLGKRG